MTAPAAGTAESIAAAFHETYERRAPDFAYSTRPASAVPWDKVPDNNRNLMAAVVAELIERRVISPGAASAPPTITAQEAAARSAAVLRMAEDQGRTSPEAALAFSTVAGGWRDLSAALATTPGMSPRPSDVE